MVKGKIKLQFPRRKKKGRAYIPLAVHNLSSKDQREALQCSINQCLMQHPHKESEPPEDNWEVLRKCIMETTEKYVG